jgi:hypothetical protein
MAAPSSPTILLELLQDPRKANKVMKAMMKMVKLDVETGFPRLLRAVSFELNGFAVEVSLQ